MSVDRPQVTPEWTRHRDEDAARGDVIRVCKRLHERGFVAATDGNVSVRLAQNRLLCTPAGAAKGFLTEDALLIVDLDGVPVQRSYGSAAQRRARPSSELLMHLEVYRARPDVGAVVHAHPPRATASTIARYSLSRPVLPEVVYTFVSIPTAPYALTSTDEVPRSIRPFVRHYDAILLEFHGALTCGATVDDAYFKMEKLEHTAETLIAARQLGPVRELPAHEVRRLLELRERNGLRHIPLLDDLGDGADVGAVAWRPGDGHA